ncbi:Site-specific recombinase, phage integrase family protein [Escherichia coli]|nr:Site-specific recombinase, phage integrase family protein [Escherichia coli]
MNLDKITETKRIEDFLYDLTTDFFHMKIQLCQNY